MVSCGNKSSVTDNSDKTEYGKYPCIVKLQSRVGLFLYNVTDWSVKMSITEIQQGGKLVVVQKVGENNTVN